MVEPLEVLGSPPRMFLLGVQFAIFLAAGLALLLGKPHDRSRFYIGLLPVLMSVGMVITLGELFPRRSELDIRTDFWFHYLWATRTWRRLALLGVFIVFPSLPRPKDWSNVFLVIGAGIVLTGAFAWHFWRSALFVGWDTPGPLTVAPATYLMFATLFAPTVANVCLMTSAIIRAGRLDATRQRAAYLIIPLLFMSTFWNEGHQLFAGFQDVVLGRETWIWWGFGPWQRLPGQCCGLGGATWIVGHVGTVAIALYLAIWRRSFLALGLLLLLPPLILLPPSTGLANFLLLGPLTVLGLLYTITWYGFPQPPEDPTAMYRVLGMGTGLLTFIYGYTTYATFIPTSGLLSAFGLVLSLTAGVAAGMMVVPTTRQRLLSLIRTGGMELQTQLEAYRAQLAAEIDAGTPVAERSTKLRPLRMQLGITEREHALLDHVLSTGAQGGAPRPLSEGTLFLHRYRVVKRLGGGGGGNTYLCVDDEIGREVVIKRLRSPTRSENDLRRVLHEARSFARVQHPAVVTLYGVEQLGDEGVLVLEYVPGGALSTRLREGPLGRESFLPFATALLRGIAAVHDEGVIHRDIKPSNILIAKDGGPKLADFGIAHGSDLQALTVTLGALADVVGTVQYMSPEQARGQEPTLQSDLFSAAATLYEAWTGEPYLKPQLAESAMELLMRAASRGPFDAPLEGPRALVAWFEKALHPDPSARFADAHTMRVALEEAISG